MVDSVFELLGMTIYISAHGKEMVLAAVLGFLIGVERALRGKPASMRTFSVICVGSCLFTILSVEAAGGAHALPHDVTRVAAQIVTGVGFLGGGVIFKTSDRIEGITTGALIWLTAAIGMACGFNQIDMVLWAFAIGMIAQFMSSVMHTFFDHRKVPHRAD
ncbi:MAG: MgtC/SapB family protein [Bdellovibrionota bacterium]